ncbi:MAG: aminotransferase, partial [Candidatus Hydrothermarchaeota archaeon]|nr:aminotransferase [Candidatus Hydrothermarchaeota archaeon]
IKIPHGLTDDDIRGRLKRGFGILLAGGQEHLKGKIFRIGHMGNIGYLDLMEVISALELVLKRAGHKFELGSGVKAAQEIFM